MKHLALVLLLIAGFASSCKKSSGTDVITPVDPRDKLVASYAVGFNISIVFGSIALQPESYSGTVTVAKAPKDTQLLLTFDLPSGKETLTAELTNNTYKIIDKTTEPIIINGQRFDGQYSATGQFTDKNEFIFTSVSQYIDLKKTTSMTGTKK